MAPQTGLEPVTPQLTRRRVLRIVRFRDLQSFVLSKAHSLRRSSSPRKVVTFRGPHFFCTRLLQPRCKSEYRNNEIVRVAHDEIFGSASDEIECRGIR